MLTNFHGVLFGLWTRNPAGFGARGSGRIRGSSSSRSRSGSGSGSGAAVAVAVEVLVAVAVAASSSSSRSCCSCNCDKRGASSSRRSSRGLRCGRHLRRGCRRRWR